VSVGSARAGNSLQAGSTGAAKATRDTRPASVTGRTCAKSDTRGVSKLPTNPGTVEHQLQCILLASTGQGAVKFLSAEFADRSKLGA